jgi:hypothetical protein
MQKDPGQLKDVSKEKPKLLKQFQAAVDKFKQEVAEGAIDENRPFLIGHKGFHITHLPARDAEGTGSIERSARPPNDSFLKNWISTDDTINWDVEVVESGRYAAEIYYSCPEKDVGSTIELEFNGAAVSSKVHEAHDPPYLGIEYIRRMKSESPVKIFRKMGLGTINLDSGSGTLKLKATDIPGDQAIDFRLLTLTRVHD